MKWTVADCKDKWKNIRNGFVRSLKPCSSGSSAKVKKPYYLHDEMKFVLPYVKPVQHSENTGNISHFELINDAIHVDEGESQLKETEAEETIEIETVSNDTSTTQEKQSIQTETFTHGRKKKKFKKDTMDSVDEAFLNYLTNKKGNPETEDHRKMFLLSLLPDVNKLSHSNLRRFKMQTLELLDNMLARQQRESTGSPLQTSIRSEMVSDGAEYSSSSTSYLSTPYPSPVSPVPSPITYGSHNFF